jgi:hypothetical protein
MFVYYSMIFLFSKDTLKNSIKGILLEFSIRTSASCHLFHLDSHVRFRDFSITSCSALASDTLRMCSEWRIWDTI